METVGCKQIALAIFLHRANLIKVVFFSKIGVWVGETSEDIQPSLIDDNSFKQKERLAVC